MLSTEGILYIYIAEEEMVFLVILNSILEGFILNKYNILRQQNR